MKHSLAQAYRDARYVVYFKKQEKLIQVGRPCLWLDDLLKTKRLNCAAFVTAFNPQSQLLDDLTNKLNQQKLENIIRSKGYFYLTGFSCDPKGEWPQEQSLLIFGLDQKDAEQIAKYFNQLAYLWLESGFSAKLVDILS